MKKQNDRDRVQSVLNGQQPVRPVADLGGRVASISLPAYLDLKSYLGFGRELDGETITLLNTVDRIDERVLEALDVPIRYLNLRPASSFKLETAPDGSYRDEWGVTFTPKGPYRERTGHPLADIRSISELDAYHWPDPRDGTRTAGLKEESKWLFQETGYALAAGHVSAGIFQDCWNLRGMERFLMDMIVDREFAEALLDRVLAVHLELWETFLEVVGDLVEFVGTADDLAGQQTLLISPEMYRTLIKPRHAALNAVIRKHTKAKILYHSCGSVLHLLDDIMDTGIDILNPIQPLPGSMDPENLSARYGGRLIFHGGLDVQTLLVNGTPGEIRDHVYRYFDVLGPSRYIMAPANTILAGTSPQNIVAAYEAVKTYWLS